MAHILGTTQRLAVDADVIDAAHDLSQAEQPTAEANPKLLRVDRLKHTLKRVVRWDAVGQRQKPLQPHSAALTEARDVTPGVGAGDNSANCDDDNVQETVLLPVPTARVPELAKVELAGQA